MGKSVKEGGRVSVRSVSVFITEQCHYTVLRAVCGNSEEIRNQ